MPAWSGRGMRYQDPAAHREQGARQAEGEGPGQLGMLDQNHVSTESLTISVQVFIVALSRTNNTKLNGAVIDNESQVQLYHEDQFTIGDRHFRWEYPTGSRLFQVKRPAQSSSPEMLLEKIEELETALRQERQEKMALRKEKLALTKKNQDLTEQNKIQKRRIDRMQTMSCDLAVFPTRTIQLFPSRRQLQEPWSSDPGMDTTNN